MAQIQSSTNLSLYNRMEKKIQFNSQGRRLYQQIISKASQSKIRSAFGLKGKKKQEIIDYAENLAESNNTRLDGSIKKLDKKLSQSFAYLAKEYNKTVDIININIIKEKQKAKELAKKAKAIERKKQKEALKKIKKFVKKTREKIAVSIKIEFRGYNKKKGSPVYLTTTETTYKTALVSNTPNAIRKFVNDEFEAVKRQTNFYKEEYEMKSINISPVPDYTRIFLQGVRVQRAGVLELDSARFKKNPEWCRNRNMCFVDYIQYRLKDKKGYKKKITDEMIQKLSLETEMGDEIADLDPEPNKNGYTIEHMCNYAKNINASIYILSDDELIYHHINDQGMSLALVFEIKNSHLYPIIDNAFVKSVVTRVQEVNIDSDKIKEQVKEKEKKDYEIIEYNSEFGTGLDYAVRTMHNEKLQVYDKPLVLNHGQLAPFVLNDKKYLTFGKERDDYKPMKQYCDDNGIKYEGQGAQYFTKKYLKDFEETYSSYFNSQVEKCLLAENVKHRTHLGICSDRFDELINDTKNLYCVDINRHYRYCMENPREDYMVIQFYKTIKITNEYKGLGLYYIESDDYSLLHGNNWYSSAMVQYAMSENISFTIKCYIEGDSIGKTVLSDICKKIIDEVGENSASKTMINSIYGYMCKTSSNRTQLRIDTDKQKVWDNYLKYKGKKNEEPTVFEIDIDDTRYYAYGNKSSSIQKNQNFPIAIQIQDQSNIKLHQLAKQMGGEVLFRKTDMILGHNPEPINAKPSNVVGGFKDHQIPEIEKMRPQKSLENRSAKLPKVFQKWNDLEYDVSDDYKEIVDFALNNHGLQLIGRAGTGKTFIAKYLIHQAQEKKIGHTKLAFTNKATINLNGQTIHSFFKLTKNGQISKSWVKKIKKVIKLVVVDEISMIDSELWKILVEFKQLTGCMFVIIGDYRQLAPINSEGGINYDWFNHPSIKYLANSNRCELSKLSVNSRYDQEMWDFLEDIWNGNYSSKTTAKLANFENWVIEDLVGNTNICYRNKTRKYVNKIIEDYLIQGKEFRSIPYQGQANNYNQDARLFVGAKLLMYKTIKDSETKERILAKNESVTVTMLGESNYLIENDSGQTHELPYDKFHTDCILGYATTIHKSQGDTVKGRLNIFDLEFITDWLKDKRALYTALSRATSLENIHIMK